MNGDRVVLQETPDSERVADLRRRVRDAMEAAPVGWDCPERIDEIWMSDPLPVRKARATAAAEAAAEAAKAGTTKVGVS